MRASAEEVVYMAAKVKVLVRLIQTSSRRRVEKTYDTWPSNSDSLNLSVSDASMFALTAQGLFNFNGL